MKKFFEGTAAPGIENAGRCGPVFIVVEGKAHHLEIQDDLVNYSLQRYEWGSNDPQCNALSLAILAYTGSNDFAVDHHRTFTQEVVSRFQGNRWTLDYEFVRGWIHDLKTREGTARNKHTRGEL